MEITEKQIERICDYYCRFPRDRDLTQEQVGALCEKCPLREVMKCKD